MASMKVLIWVLNALILTLAVSLPFVQSSSSSLPYRRNMIEKTAIGKATQSEVEKFGNGASVGVVEDSARRVPTGPDPLHHNNNPLDP